MTRCFLILFAVFPVLAFAHPGGLDNAGGHRKTSTGKYHCHSDPCLSNESAIAEAEQEERAFSHIYNREDWKHWSDWDDDCMNTRHEILKVQADGPITLSDDGCKVISGVWDDPFSGETLTLASDLDVDHIVPLKWANGHGGSRWSVEKKEQFANDPINLLAVDDGLNQAKGARGPDEWIPPNEFYWCEYMSAWRRVLAKYSDLTLTKEEGLGFLRRETECRLYLRFGEY